MSVKIPKWNYKFPNSSYTEITKAMTLKKCLYFPDEFDQKNMFSQIALQRYLSHNPG